MIEEEWRTGDTRGGMRVNVLLPQKLTVSGIDRINVCARIPEEGGIPFGVNRNGGLHGVGSFECPIDTACLRIEGIDRAILAPLENLAAIRRGLTVCGPGARKTESPF